MALNVVCLKHGTKYGPEYVNKLYNMIQRHLTVPHQFVCFTDNPEGLDSRINIHILPNDQSLQGWWWKLYLFKEGHFSNDDTILFFDLDMVIVKNIDNLVSYLPDSFVGLEDVGRIFNRAPKLGSAVMRWPANQYSKIWNQFNLNRTLAQRWPGDQDWIWKICSNEIKFFPRSWIISYKWEARNIKELIRDGKRYKFKDIRDPKIPDDTCVLAFHGSPDPHEVSDPIIVNNWR